MKYKSFKFLKFIIPLVYLQILLPNISRADETAYRIDGKNAFAVVERKAVFHNQEGKFPTKNRNTEREFPGQKLFIKWTCEIGGGLIFNGNPIVTKDPIAFNHLLFSPDHKVAIAYGMVLPYGAKRNHFVFINEKGSIINTGVLNVATAKASPRGFVGLCDEVTGSQQAIQSGHSIIHYYLCMWDLAGKELWKKEVFGSYAEGFPGKLSVSPNGKFIILGLDKKNNWPGSTLIFDEKGNELDDFDETYYSLFSRDNETAVLASHKKLRVINVKDKTILFKLDLDSKTFFPIPENDPTYFGLKQNPHHYGFVVSEMTDHLLKGIILVDMKRKRVTRMMMEPKDWGVFRVFYYELGNKILIKTFDIKDPGMCESINLE